MLETLKDLLFVATRLLPEPWLKLRLRWMGCRNIKVEGICWSFDQPRKGRRWAGGIGAVRQYIHSGGFVARTPRSHVRLAIDDQPIYTDANGG